MFRLGTFALIIGGLLLVAGCSDEDKEKKPCPAEGLGVKSSSGKLCSGILDTSDPDWKDCSDQIEHFDEYDCSKPQICTPDASFVTNVYRLVAGYQGESIPFAINNCSTGNQQLTITKVELMGDARCSFTFKDSSDYVEKKIVEPGGPSVDASTIRTIFKPDKLGEDHAAFKITSNAQNYPTYVIPICYKVTPKTAPGVDGGYTPDSSLFLPKGFTCKDVSKTPRSCP
jgi:hypothetical protein